MSEDIARASSCLELSARCDPKAASRLSVRPKASGSDVSLVRGWVFRLRSTPRVPKNPQPVCPSTRRWLARQVWKPEGLLPVSGKPSVSGRFPGYHLSSFLGR